MRKNTGTIKQLIAGCRGYCFLQEGRTPYLGCEKRILNKRRRSSVETYRKPDMERPGPFRLEELSRLQSKLCFEMLGKMKKSVEYQLKEKRTNRRWKMSSSITCVRQFTRRTAFTRWIGDRRAVFIGFFPGAAFNPHERSEAFLAFPICAHQLFAIGVLAVDDRRRAF